MTNQKRQPKKPRNIVFIPGITTTRWMASKWEAELLKECPDDKVFILREFYLHTQKSKLNEIINDINAIVRSGAETILIAHSFGGVLALAAYFRNIDRGRDNIKKIITIATPHSTEAFHLKEIKEYLRYKNTELDEVEVQTFGGLFDSLVPNKHTKIMFKDHTTFLCGHNAFLFSRRIIRKIIKSSL